jgi:hypothetical protein
MSRTSQSQRKRAAELEELLGKSCDLPCPTDGDCKSGITKETNHKRVSLPHSQAREGSPHRAAATPAPGKPRAEEEKQSREGLGLVEAAARSVFGRQELYSVDGHGRRTLIEERVVGSVAYGKLLEAARENARLPARPTESRVEAPVVGLPVPEWWETELGATSAEKIATIRENLRMASERRGALRSPGTWRRP